MTRSPLAAAAVAPLVGARIAVFWPLDNAFYPGTVLYALPNNRHIVLYDDEYKETLNLSTERFRTLKPAPPPPPPLQPHVLPSLTYVPPALPPRKRYSRRSHLRSRRPTPRLSTPLKKTSLTIRVRPPALSTGASLLHAKPKNPKLPSTRDLLSEVSNVPPSPPTQPQLALSQLPTLENNT